MPAKEIMRTAKDKMDKSVHALEEKFQTLRTGRASVSQFEHIMVEYYGTPTPLNQLSNISIPEPRLVVIQAWDVSTLAQIEKAITNSSMSLNPQNDGKLIRISIPPLTDETRMQNVKQAKQLAEEAKVALRNIRRDAIDKIKKLEHDSQISEDERTSHEAEIQNIIDSHIQSIQKLLEDKEKEINEV